MLGEILTHTSRQFAIGTLAAHQVNVLLVDHARRLGALQAETAMAWLEFIGQPLERRRSKLRYTTSSANDNIICLAEAVQQRSQNSGQGLLRKH